MLKLKKLETILAENEWRYDSDNGTYTFPKLDKRVKTDTLQHRAGQEVGVAHAHVWPKEFLEEVADEEKIYRVKLKDMHIAMMMADYKFVEDGLIFILGDKEFKYPSNVLPKFGNIIEVRQNKKGELECVESGVMIHSLLIEGVISSSKQNLVTTLAALWASV